MSTYEDKTNAELRDELDARGLPVSGNKDDLIERLEQDDAESAEAESATEKVLAADEGVAEEANPNPEDTGQADPAPALKDAEVGDRPVGAQVQQQEGWVIQRGAWRKGAGE